MFGRDWSTSPRAYKVVVEHDVKIPVRDGTLLNANVFRPDAGEKFPAILGYFPYHMSKQTAPIKVDSFSSAIFKHPGQELTNASIESGDPWFFGRRGYAHVLVNIRGTGKSEGRYNFLGCQEQQDGHDVIEWIARQPWCSGNVGMFGVSYFAWIQQYVAATRPPHLKCLFGPWAASDMYRDGAYHGGILAHKFWCAWSTTELDNPRMESQFLKTWGEEKYQKAIERALQDEAIAAIPELVEILKNPTRGRNPLIVDLLLNPTWGPYWDERRVRFDQIQVPAYIGGCWGHVGLHTPGAFRSWENLKVPKKMILGPPAYLDRPLMQLHNEALRWFDYWLKGIDNGIMDEPAVRLYRIGMHDWKHTSDWPVPGTRWTPFYLHEKGLINEHDYRTNEGSSSFEDSPWARGELKFYSPPMVENTEIMGPSLLNLYASTSSNDVLLFASLWKVDSGGKERLLTRGWLKGSHRELDLRLSKPWCPVHTHSHPRPLEPGHVYEFNIPIVPTGTLFQAGSHILLKIRCTDDPPKDAMEAIGAGHISSPGGSRITIYHNDEYPSNLVLPVTEGNYMGTFVRSASPYEV
jgi:putative CocE/NonD family hydrolase